MAILVREIFSSVFKGCHPFGMEIMAGGAFRWCRFAQPPATGWDASGITPRFIWGWPAKTGDELLKHNLTLMPKVRAIPLNGLSLPETDLIEDL